MSASEHDLAEFERTWRTPPGIRGWFTAVNNQPLGKRFMVTSLTFFFVGGALALVMRVQLAVSENTVLGPQVYNQFFTMHGSTMMYLFAVPFVEGLALYVLPLMVGSRDVAFPRLTAFSYWTYLFGGLVFYAGFLFDTVPDAGWFAYTPLSTGRFSGSGIDFWVLGLGLVEIAGISAGAEIVVTILKLRAPGMSINRLPLFCWALLIAGVMMLFAFSTLLTATLMLELDRTVQTRFFDSTRGGNSLLWQHLFWFFGHPEVYIIFLPATGIVSMIVSAFARNIAGYTFIAVAILLTGFVSFGLWVHHMYTTGLPALSMNFFAAASLMIAIASGTQIFAWIASLWGRRPAYKTAFLYVLGFIVLFTLGGLTGVMVAVVPFDWQVHDTFFIVAHFHYVLIGGVVFPVMGGLYYWLPKITGRMLSETLGRWGFWLTFIGFNVTFLPMHLMGFYGMPRRVYTYSRELGIDGYNLAATFGAFAMGAGFLLFVVDFLRSLRTGKVAPDNPWGGDSLEWSTPSPPPNYSFRRPPIVTARHPLWQQDGGGISSERSQRAVAALDTAPSAWRGTLVTDVVTAEPQAIQWLPGASYAAPAAAFGLLVASVGVLIRAYLLLPFGLAFTVVALLYWLWPRDKQVDLLTASSVGREAGLPIFAIGPRSTAWWGMACLIAVLTTVFGTLFYSYFYLRLYSTEWPQDGLPRPRLLIPLLGYSLLVLSSGLVWWGMRRFWQGEGRKASIAMAAAFLAGLIFVVFEIEMAILLPFSPRVNAYATVFHVLLWVVVVHVLAALALSAAAQLRLYHAPEEREGFTALILQLASMLWYFVSLAGLLVFAVLYLSPYVL